MNVRRRTLIKSQGKSSDNYIYIYIYMKKKWSIFIIKINKKNEDILVRERGWLDFSGFFGGVFLNFLLNILIMFLSKDVDLTFKKDIGSAGIKMIRKI